MCYNIGMMNIERLPAKAWYALRYSILERDNYTCQYCGQHAPNVKLEVDHKLALVDGGTDDPENLVTSCYACNQGKEGLRSHRAAQTRTPRRRLSRKHRKTWRSRDREPSPRIVDLIAKVLSFGAMGTARLAGEIGKPENTVRTTLWRHSGRHGMFVQVDKKWGLLEQTPRTG